MQNLGNGGRDATCRDAGHRQPKGRASIQGVKVHRDSAIDSHDGDVRQVSRSDHTLSDLVLGLFDRLIAPGKPRSDAGVGKPDVDRVYHHNSVLWRTTFATTIF